MICLMQKFKRRPGCRWTCVIISILIAGLAAGAAMPGFAEDLPEILPLNPVPVMPGHWIFTGEGPANNVVVGVLDRLGAKEVVVDDFLYWFSSEQETVFYSADSVAEIPRSDFKLGDLVGCELDGNGRVEILWLFED